MSLNSHTTWLHYKTQRMKLAHRVAYLYLCVKTHSLHTVCVLIGMHSRRQHSATHCNTLQHTATHCNTLQHTATHCNTLQHTATHGNTRQHTETNLFTPDSAARRGGTKSLHRTATHSNTLQHTATPCNTLTHI